MEFFLEAVKSTLSNTIHHVEINPEMVAFSLYNLYIAAYYKFYFT
jgi:hypothetical protein